MFRPPVNRAMKILDRSFFRRNIPLSAAKIFEKKKISKFRTELGQEMLKIERMQIVRSVFGPDGEEVKALLLRPDIKSDDPSTWSPKISELVNTGQIQLTPYNLDIDYDYWNYHDILSSILPEEDQGDYPTGFSIVGHVAHLNLREQYLPYKNIIADILLDKNPTIRTVINKIDEVGEQNEYRTFSYELLAGDDDMNVEIHEENCIFRFDYSKVYWNSRLNTEHKRLVSKFQPGQAICDIMAGVGPFAIPAGKKNCFVWANDLNPDSYASLKDAIRRNKVWNLVKRFNQDGHVFIGAATKNLMLSECSTTFPLTFSRRKRSDPPPEGTVVRWPKTFSHYVLNLPATAINFLPSFVGIFEGCSKLFKPFEPRELPMIHVYCFNTKSDDNKEEGQKICWEISEQLGYRMRPGSPENEGEVEIWDVRDVAPQKRMFCATFQLPKDVAFREQI